MDTLSKLSYVCGANINIMSKKIKYSQDTGQQAGASLATSIIGMLAVTACFKIYLS